ncbi:MULTISPECIES: FadR/GntR family transcriptional regulator [Sphingobium]|uniref:FadR/GntR family transcriptional regulator n=1 Tax=Sphingobium TaxID=165695 RepID=UPI0007F3A559|nr:MULTISPECIES: FCD domain-containing protein [Sphingobium]MCC4256215.1 FCD domain-containing protein [Sphingobium lactosutens]OAN58251.1 hypothetical protein A7Q26_14605 [Sphingobium sp. TCM1]
MTDHAPIRQRASDAIADQLRREIAAGAFADGLLDPTPQLMQRFGVSRPTLREAFRMLESERLIEVRHGSRTGVRVRQPSGEGAVRMTGQTLQAAGTTIEQLYEARLAFEPFAARLVAQRCDRRDIGRLRGAHADLDGLLEARAWPALGAAMARFHHLLVELTGNQMLTLTADTIATLLERHQRNRNAALHEPADPDASWLAFRGLGVRSVARLIALVEAGDADAAEVHWRLHVEGANDYWLKGEDRHAVIDVIGDRGAR